MASGDSLFAFEPGDYQTPAANAATLDERNNHMVLDFDPTTNETAYFEGTIPEHYDSGGITVEVQFAMSAATTSDVDIDVAFENLSGAHTDAGGLDVDDFAAVQSVDNITVPGVSGLIGVASIAFTAAQADDIGAGEKFRLSVTRDAASDGAAGDMELVAVAGRET